MNHKFGEHVDACRADAREEEVGVKAMRSPGTLQVHAKHPEKEHVQQDVPEAAVQEDIGYRLPHVQLEKEVVGNESELTIHQAIGGGVEKLQKRLNEKDADAGQNDIANRGGDEFTPLRAHPGISRERTHKERV
jgi:hypothetical protein